jgi:hypothetical protein
MLVVGDVAVAVTENVALLPEDAVVAEGCAEILIKGYVPASMAVVEPPPEPPVICAIVPAAFLI